MLYKFFKILLITTQLFYHIGAIGTSFLTVPMYARELALGGLNPSIMGDPSLFRGNPALIVDYPSASTVFFGYNVWLADTKGMSLLVTNPAFGGTLGIGLRQISLSNLELRTTTPTDDYLSLFSASGTALEGTWGKKLNRAYLGASLRWIRIESYIHVSTGFSADFGFGWSFLKNKITMGAAILNVGKMNPFKNEVPELPTSIIAGVTVKTHPLFGLSSKKYNTYTSVVGEYSKAHSWVVRISGELFYNPVRFTLGTKLSNELISLGIGLGINWRRFQLSYGLEIGSHQIDIPHLFQFGITLP